MKTTVHKEPKQARSRERVDRILAAATEMLAEIGTPMTLRGLAGRAQVSPGTLYQFFDSLDAVKAAVTGRAVGLLARALDEGAPMKGANDPVAFFSALIATVDAMQQAHPELGCMVRAQSRSKFSENLAKQLRSQVARHVTDAFCDAARATDDEVAERTGMAATVLSSLLEQAPDREDPRREVYLARTAELAAAALRR